MKFTGKYEILELLASGRVSTFLVRERATQQQSLVHCFDCPATLPADAPQPAIFKHFASLAPSPVGRILEVGIDEESAAAFIVTSLPTTAALQNWIRSYNAFTESEAMYPLVSDEDATAELSAAEVNAILNSKRDADTQPPARDAKPDSATRTFPMGQQSPTPVETKGEFTRLFEDLGAHQGVTDTTKSDPTAPKSPIQTGKLESPVTSRAPSPAPVITKPSESGPGSFTQEFFLGKKGNPATPEVTSGSNYPSDSGEKEPGSFTREFFAAASRTEPKTESKTGADRGPTPPPAALPGKSSSPVSTFAGLFDSPSSAPTPKGPSTNFDWTPPAADKNSTGEFTSFFRGPFDQPGASKKLDTIPDLADAGPVRQQTGEFTQIFGNESSQPAKFPEPQPLPEKTPGTFTQIFGKNPERSAQLGVSRLQTDPGQRSASPLNLLAKSPLSESKAAEKGSSILSSPAGNFSAPKAPNIAPSAADSTLLHRAGPADATDVFRVPGGAASPAVEEVPAGPSEFTVFLSRSQISAALPPEPVMAPPPAAKPAPLPQLGFPPPPAPPAPAGVVAAPPMPQSAPPPMPKPPAPPAVAQLASYWPLITVLTVLIAVGAMLVMYFAFKH